MRTVWLLAIAACHPPPPTPEELAFRAQQAMPPYSGTTTCTRATASPRPWPPARAYLHAVGDVRVEGSTRDEIGSRITARQHQLRNCYQRALSFDPELSGRAIIRLEIKPDGTAAITVTGLGAEIDACLCGVLAAIDFPPSETTSHVSFPLLFSNGI